MESSRLTRRGVAVKTPEGRQALMNRKGVGYLVPASILVIWENFENNTVDEVAAKLASMTGRAPDDLREPITEIARGLEEAELLLPA